MCIRWGTKYGPEYVRNLADQVRQGTTRNYNFICYTDQPERIDGVEYRRTFNGLKGWYQKIGLFKLGELKRPTLFLDLDVIVTPGSLDKFLDWPHSFGIIKDFMNWSPFNSSVMFIQPNINPDIYNHFTKSPYVHPKGDQGIIGEFLPDAETFPADWCASYKVNQVKEEPEGAIVIFHGDPKPPDCQDEWIRKYWP